MADPVGAPMDMPPCPDSAFTVEPDSQNTTTADSGWLTTTLTLRSVSTDACQVPLGSTPAELIDDTGGALPFDFSPAGGGSTVSSLAVQPGQLVSVVVNWAVVGTTVPRPVLLAVSPSGEYPGQRLLTVPLTGIDIPANPERPSNVGPWRSTAIESVKNVTDADSLSSLNAIIAAPGTATIGTPLRYTVALTNPSSTDVSLLPCPHFVQTLDVVQVKIGTTVRSTGPLNCADAPRVLAGSTSITFDFEMDISGQVPGTGQLLWQLIDGTSAVTSQVEIAVIR